MAIFDLDSAAAGGVAAYAEGGVGTFSLRKAKVDEDTAVAVVVEEEIGRFDITVQDAGFVDCGEGTKQGAEIGLHV